MDSMRSLNTSLPRSPRKKRSSHPPEQLIQAFKTAALSVTNLYKTAAADQDATRESGYQEALDDLLGFLDRENIGLDDGEGWRIRQWATERLDGSSAGVFAPESEGDQPESSKSVEHEPPNTSKSNGNHRSVSRSASPAQPDTVSQTQQNPPIPNCESQPRTDMFTFKASVPYPQDVDMPTRETHGEPAASSPSRSHVSIDAPATALRVEVVPRSTRVSQRAVSHLNRVSSRPTGNSRLGGPGTGSKRRFAIGDYFDLGSIGECRDVSGGGKRNRLA